jgi:putative peptide zinc metalloprotease protein
MDANPALLGPLQKRLDSVNKKLDRLKKRAKDLIIHARMSGVWSAPRIEDRIGSWLPRGTSIGLVVDPTLFEFIATVGQDDGATLFAEKETEAEVRLRGQSSEIISIDNILVIPGEQTILPSAALGWRGGGEVAVDLTDPEGITASEPFFEVRGQLLPKDAVAMLHGRSGMIRFDRDPEAILPRIMRKLRQVFQEHYSL